MLDKERYPRLAERLNRELPNGRQERVHEFAMDLAVGYEESAWDDTFLLLPAAGGRPRNEWIPNPPSEDFRANFQHLAQKWTIREGVDPDYPDLGKLERQAYIEPAGGDTYALTPKALELLEAPHEPPNVFISYSREESSALALLLETRISYETNATPFLDKSLDPGDEWHGSLETRVKEAKAFICLLGRYTLNSRFVRKEIEWALSDKGNKLIMPVWHNNFDTSRGEYPDLIEELNRHQAVHIREESADGYDAGVDKILNRLGYSTAFIEKMRRRQSA